MPGDVWFDQDFTIVAWVRLHSYANWERIIDFGVGPDNHNVLLAASAGILGQPALRTEGTQFTASSITLPVSRWTQIAARVRADGLGTIFINGVESYNSGGMTIPPSVTRTNCYIGKSNWSSDALLNGEMGELQIYHGALSNTAITANYNATKSKYPNSYSFSTIHSIDGSSNDRWSGISVVDSGVAVPQVGWLISDYTNTATITGVNHQNTALGFVYTLAITGTISTTADYVALIG